MPQIWPRRESGPGLMVQHGTIPTGLEVNRMGKGTRIVEGLRSLMGAMTAMGLGMTSLVVSVSILSGKLDMSVLTA